MKKNYYLLNVFSNLFILFILISNFCFSQINAPLNTRLFQPTQSQGFYNQTFIKHLNSLKNETFFSFVADGSSSYYNINYTGVDYSRIITRLGEDGIPKWIAKFDGDRNDSNFTRLNISQDFACVDKDDNLLIFCDTKQLTSNFTDSSGKVFNFQGGLSNLKILLKIDKNGKLIWHKEIVGSQGASVITDRNGDVYILGLNGSSIDDISLGSIYIVKLNSLTGNIIYTKSYNNIGAYQFIPVFDSQNNLYVFTEPINNLGTDYNFDGVIIPTNTNQMDNLMLKFDTNGNVIWGKNFHATNSLFSYSWINDAIFDGTDIIVSGNFWADKNNNFLGLDGTSLVKYYSNSIYAGLIAKIDISGNIKWQKYIEDPTALNTTYTNIDLDELGNIYGYFNFKDKIFFNNNEYQFDSAKGNKVLSKFDNNGNVIYFNSADLGINQGYNSVIDVIGNDKINCSSFTVQNYFQDYPLTNSAPNKLYIATFGNLDSKYLSPQKNYLSLSNLSISNNPNNDNKFSFDLINNVNWTVESDQSWLNLGFQKLSQRTNSSTLINGTGDSKITMTAEANNTGLSRTANVLVAGDSGVSSSTIIVTQTGTLGTQESKTFVITLYPNPTSEVLSIQSQEKISKAEIYDFTGKLLLEMTVIDKKINVNALSKGTYFIKLYTEKGIVNSKFIKN